MLPMSDGVRLHTLVVTPASLKHKQFPTVIDRSPYGMFNTELLADVFLLFGFAAVSQDLRGACKSEGKFSLWHTDEADGKETIDWTVRQPWSDGTIYEVGASADGIASFVLARAAPTALRAQLAIFATAEARRAIFPGGALRAGLTEGWLKGTVPAQAAGLIAEVERREAPSAWWDAVEMRAAQFARVAWPSVMWAGWYDIFLHGQLYAFDGYQHHSAPAVRGAHYLVIDPLGHCQRAARYFPRHLLAGRALLPVLLGLRLFRGEPHRVPAHVHALTFYVMGSRDAPRGVGNYWTSLREWPAATPTPLYLAAGGALSWAAPGGARGGAAGGASAATAWRYSPSDPTPTIGGNNLELSCGPLDQRPIEARADVAVFTSDALVQPLALTGALEAVLHVSTRSAVNDTDFALKLTDVHPDGTSRLVQDGIQRMRWRAGPRAATPLPMAPNVTYRINISLWNTSYVFAAGHRLRVVVSSANAPRFRANPNTGVPLSREDGRTRDATNVVWHAADTPSALILPVVALAQLPEHNIIETVGRMLDEAAADADALLADEPAVAEQGDRSLGGHATHRGAVALRAALERSARAFDFEE